MSSVSSVIPEKSPEDKRSYRVVTLPNDLQAVLISDPETDKAAAAMDVRVGHFSDPDHLPGLAHFLEHMLFLGTEKYPNENEYSAFLNEHGGGSNAYTSTENTNYHFDVTHEHLEHALDRFAQFFVAPLFTPSATEREIQAVDNEHQKNLQRDVWRYQQLLKSTSDPKHPFSKFGSGNAFTLHESPKEKSIDVRAALLDFHKTYYSANIMKLSVIGREPLDTLEKWVTDKFTGVRCTKREPPVFGPQPFHAESLQRVYRVVPVKDERELYISWALPPVRKFFRQKPVTLLSQFVGHEGKGSILSLLKKRAWANGLASGVQYNQSSFATFSVSIELTPEGLNHVDEIVHIVYQYLQLIRQASSAQLQAMFDEESNLQAMSFRFKGKEEPISYCTSQAESLHHYPPEELLTGPYLMRQWDEALMRSFLDELVPQKMRIDVTSQSFKGQTDMKEKWYGTEYSSQPLDETFVKLLSSPGLNHGLAVPEPNDFIPTDFAIKHHVLDKPAADEGKDCELVPSSLPRIISEHKGLTVWHKLDATYLKPKANFYVKLHSPFTYASASEAVLAAMYIRLVDDALNEYSYAANLAGLHRTIASSDAGLTLSVRGYNHKMATLLKRMLEHMRSTDYQQERFAVIKEQLVRGLRNWVKEQPYQHAAFFQNQVLDARLYSPMEKLEVEEDVTLEAVKSFIPRFLSRLGATALVHGNLTKEEAVDLSSMLSDALRSKPLPTSQYPPQRISELPEGKELVAQLKHANADDPNSALVMCFQVGPDTPSTMALVELLSHIITEPCYNQLRTIEQLGYLVWSGCQNMKGVLSLRIIVQSGAHPADYLHSRALAFLNSFQRLLAEMDEKTFETNKAAVVARLEEKDKTLGQETQRYWNELSNGRSRFGISHEVSSLVKKLDKASLLSFFRKTVSPSSHRLLSVQVFSASHALPSLPSPQESPLPGTVMHMQPRQNLQPITKPAAAKDSDKEEQQEKAAESQVQVADLFDCSERPVYVITDLGKLRNALPLHPQQTF